MYYQAHYYFEPGGYLTGKKHWFKWCVLVEAWLSWEHCPYWEIVKVKDGKTVRLRTKYGKTP